MHNQDSTTPQVVFVGGASRSGSTLFSRYLAGKGAVAVGELHLASYYLQHQLLCTCGEALTRCSFWSEVLARLSRNESAAAETLELATRASATQRSLIFARDIGADQERVEALQSLYEAISDVAGGRVVVDSSKSAVAMNRALHTSPAVTGVVLFRELSRVRRSWETAKADPRDDSGSMRTKSRVRSYADWSSSYLALARVSNQSCRLLHLDYFLSAPEDAAEGLLHEDRSGGFAEHQIAGNPDRLTPLTSLKRPEPMEQLGPKPVLTLERAIESAVLGLANRAFGSSKYPSHN